MKKKSIIVSVLLVFFVMGFCDVVGIATSYLKSDFNLSETISGLIPSMVFVWFAILSVPSALMMNRIGRKKTVQLSNIITFVGMLIPFIHYNFTTCIIAFILLGIGNTILQVSLNPLLASVVNEKDISSYLTAGQVIKAVSSFCGPFIAAFSVAIFGNWMYIFPIFAFFTILSFILMFSAKIEDEPTVQKSARNGNIFHLFKDKVILLLFLGIFAVVGVDIGTNTVSTKLVMERVGWTVDKAGLAASVYFICRTTGALLGVFFLSRFNDAKYFLFNITGAILSIIPLMFAHNIVLIFICIGLIGFFCASIFSIIFSAALKARPEKANEISGLMITGIAGGAVIPPLMGIFTDLMGSQVGSLSVILVCMLYMAFCACWILRKQSQEI